MEEIREALKQVYEEMGEEEKKNLKRTGVVMSNAVALAVLSKLPGMNFNRAATFTIVCELVAIKIEIREYLKKLDNTESV